MKRISKDIKYNMNYLKNAMNDSADLVQREIKIAGKSACFVCCEGLINMQVVGQIIFGQLYKIEDTDCTPDELIEIISTSFAASVDLIDVYDFDTLLHLIMSGFVVIMVEGSSHGLVFGAQGFPTRSISEPSTEQNIRGSRESFVETMKLNQTLIRRRIKNGNLKFEMMTLGEKSQTDISLVYMTDTASPEIIDLVKAKLQNADLDYILDSAYLESFLEDSKFSLFSTVGVVERPDTFCGKIIDGRVGIIVDGSPFALVVPYIFADNFQAFDDYTHKPFFADFIRIIKYICIITSAFLPGLYVAATTYHPEMIPSALLMNIAAAEENIPLPIMLEALLVYLLYEIVREAGLRLPRALSHSVGIIGGLVIGDAAVSAGIVSAPMIMVLALTAICSFVVPPLYDSVTFIRFMTIILGGTLGIFGLSVFAIMISFNISALSSFGVPYTSGISPTNKNSFYSYILRRNYKFFKRVNIKNLPGTELENSDSKSK